MASPTLQPPVLLTFGNIPAQMCAQAASAGSRALVLLQPIDHAGNTTLQQWQLGSDGRIYLNTPANPGSLCLTYQGEPENGEPLGIAATDPTDPTQVWQWINNQTSLKNMGASQSGTTFVIDNSGGSTSPGNKIQIWTFLNNGNQIWVAQAVPSSQFGSTSANVTAA
jgi:hypothetical protein